jgi:hypothetical protein
MCNLTYIAQVCMPNHARESEMSAQFLAYCQAADVTLSVMPVASTCTLPAPLVSIHSFLTGQLIAPSSHICGPDLRGLTCMK